MQSTTLSDKLKTFFGLFPEVKDKADNVEATLLALGVTSKEATMDTKPKDEEEKKDAPEEEKKEDAAKKEVAPVAENTPDVVGLLTNIQSGITASAKEFGDLKELYAVQSKEVGELKAGLEAGLTAVAKALGERDTAITELKTKLETESAKVKELTGEIPNAARHVYAPADSLQTIIGRIANGEFQLEAKEVKNAPTIPAAAGQTPTLDPIQGFIQNMNQGAGVVPTAPTNLPQ